MQHNLINGVARAACAVALSLSMAASPLVEGFAAAPAFADEPVQETPEQQPAENQSAEGENQAEPVAPEEPVAPPRVSKDVPLEENTSTPDDADTPRSDKYVSGVLELAKDTEPAPAAGSVVVDGLIYRINLDGKTAELAGWDDRAVPQGDVTVAAKVVSGGDEYVVTSVAKEALKNCDKIELIVLPDSVAEIGKDTFAGCTALRAIEVGEACERFATYDGMLFSKDLATLIRCPEGKGAGGGGLISLTSEQD